MERELDARLRRAVHLYWGGIREARRAAGLVAPASASQRWTRASVLAEIRALARTGQHMSQGAVAAVRQDLVEAAMKRFGRWVRARELAGVAAPPRLEPRERMSWDDSAVIAAIRDRHRDGEPLAVTKAPKALVNAANRRFGSWKDAIEAAGLNYKTIALRRDLDDDELRAWVQDAARKHPHLTVDGFDRLGEHANACRARWGTVEAVAAAAGVAGWPTRRKHRPLGREQVLRALRSLARGGKSVSFATVRARRGSAALVHSVLRNFATWDDAIKAASLPPQRRKRVPWTRDEALERLKRWHRRGVPLAYREISRRDPGAYDVLRKMFGSFAAAVAAAGLTVERVARSRGRSG